MKKILTFNLLILSCTILFPSCKKGPGEGGNSSITGKVQVIQYNAFFTDTLGIYEGRDEDVYIIYGDDVSYGDRIRTGPDGRFEFKYLRKGNYKIYLYSDTLSFVTDTLGKIVVSKELEITKKNQIIDVGTIEINKN